MEEQKPEKKNPCYCTAALGALVIVFAWWQVSWAPVALTVLGVLVIAKTFVDSCCCRDKSCKTGS